MADGEKKEAISGTHENEVPREDEVPEGGLSLELLAQIADTTPDLEIDFSTPQQKLLSGLGMTLPMAPIVNHMRGGVPIVLRGAGPPPQGMQQQGAPQAGQGAQGAGAAMPMQGHQPPGQGRGAPPPPQRYAWEDGNMAPSPDDGQETMLC